MTIGRKMDAAWKQAISNGKRKLNGGDSNYKGALAVGAGLGTGMGIINGAMNYNKATTMARVYKAFGAAVPSNGTIAKAAAKATATKLIPIHAAAGMASAAAGHAVGHKIAKRQSVIGKVKAKMGR